MLEQERLQTWLRRVAVEAHYRGVEGTERVRLATQHVFPEQLTIADVLRVAATTNNQE